MTISKLSTEHLGQLAEPAKWRRYLAGQAGGERLVLVAIEGQKIVGYGCLSFTSGYRRFARLGIPEIQELWVAEPLRGRRVAAALIESLETVARSRGCGRIGIGAGLHKQHGPAQKMYCRLGYLPDGYGVTYRYHTVPKGAQVSVDDELVLWFVKALE